MINIRHRNLTLITKKQNIDKTELMLNKIKFLLSKNQEMDKNMK